MPARKKGNLLRRRNDLLNEKKTDWKVGFSLFLGLLRLIGEAKS